MKFIRLPAFLLLATATALRAAAPQETTIQSDGPGELISNDTETVSTFKDNVVVTGTQLSMHCDYLKVTAYRKGDPKATIGRYGAFKSLVAIGNVRIVQADRVATCGRAEIFPNEDRIVLTDHPTIKAADDQYAAQGYRMTLYKGQRRAVIESNPNERTKLVLPAIKDLGFNAGNLDGSAPAPAKK